jgi:hypothetical protein
MNKQDIHDFQGPFTEDSWGILATYLEQLPEQVRVVVWGSEQNSCTEESAVDLGKALAAKFPKAIEFKHRPRKPDYDFYPVLGVMGIDERGKDIDYGVRFVGLPGWYQINTLIGAIQAVAFHGSTISVKTRIQLSRIPSEEEISLQVFTSPEDEGGVLMGTLAANLAVLCPNVKCWIGMVNDFPQLSVRFSIHNLPHTIINRNYHLQGVYDEEQMLKHLAKVLQKTIPTA